MQGRAAVGSGERGRTCYQERCAQATHAENMLCRIGQRVGMQMYVFGDASICLAITISRSVPTVLGRQPPFPCSRGPAACTCNSGLGFGGPISAAGKVGVCAGGGVVLARGAAAVGCGGQIGERRRRGQGRVGCGGRTAKGRGDKGPGNACIPGDWAGGVGRKRCSGAVRPRT